MQWAVDLQATQDNLFWDDISNEGGYYFTPETQSVHLIVRTKDFMDSAYPSGNSISAMNLLQLEMLTYDSSHKYRERATKLLQAPGGIVKKASGAFQSLLIALDFATDVVQQCAFIIPSSSPSLSPSLSPSTTAATAYRSAAQPFIEPMRLMFLPNTVIACGRERQQSTGDRERDRERKRDREEEIEKGKDKEIEKTDTDTDIEKRDTERDIEKVIGLLNEKISIATTDNSTTTAYLCEGSSCKLPTTSPTSFFDLLRSPTSLRPYSL